MTEAAFDFGFERRERIYPKKIPALFKGGEFVLLGRYKGAAPAEVVLTGNVNGETRRIVVKVEWPARNSTIRSSHASGRCAKSGICWKACGSTAQIQEIINEIVELATRHGIVTPYTSQLVLEPGMQAPQPMATNGAVFGRDEMRDFREARKGAPASPMDALRRQERAKQEAFGEAEALGGRARAMESGANATALAAAEKDLKEAANVFADKPAARAAAGTTVSEQRTQWANAKNAQKKADGSKFDLNDAMYFEQAQASLIKNVGARTFYSRGGVWVDSQVKADAKPKVIKQFSDEYFQLLKSDAELGPVLALGGKILIANGTETIQIDE